MANIFAVAAIRRFIDENNDPEFYIDVMEKVFAPSPDGDYKSFDAVVIAQSAEQKKALDELMSNWRTVKVILI